MAKLAEQQSIIPTLATLGISALLGVRTLYAWSGGGAIPKLPLTKPALVVITIVYLLRGAGGLLAPQVSRHPAIVSNS